MAAWKYKLIEFLQAHSSERMHKILSCYTCLSIVVSFLMGIACLLIFRDWNVLWGILCSPLIIRHFLVG